MPNIIEDIQKILTGVPIEGGCRYSYEEFREFKEKAIEISRAHSPLGGFEYWVEQIVFDYGDYRLEFQKERVGALQLPDSPSDTFIITSIGRESKYNA